MRDAAFLDLVDRGVGSSNGLAGGLACRQPNLAAHDPPSQLATGDLPGIDVNSESQQPVAACDVGRKAVVVALGAREARGGFGQPERRQQGSQP